MSESDPELEAIRRRKMEALQETVGRESVGHPVEVNDATLADFVRTHETVVVDCWAPWCGPCRAMAPIIDELAAKWAGRVAFAKLNTDHNPRTAQQFAIMSIPTLLIFQGGQFVDQVVGLPPKAQLVQMLSPLAA
jgi:thioredoxin 1